MVLNIVFKNCFTITNFKLIGPKSVQSYFFLFFIFFQLFHIFFLKFFFTKNLEQQVYKLNSLA